MREQLERLSRQLDRMDIAYTTDAISDLRSVLQEILPLLDQALPVDKSDDD